MNYRVAISIPTYNRKEYLENLLESIDNQIGISEDFKKFFGVYVCDNASDYDVAALLLNYSTEIQFHRHQTNLGAQFNIDYAYSWPEAEYVWVIGDDEVLAPGALSIVREILSKKMRRLDW